MKSKITHYVKIYKFLTLPKTANLSFGINFEFLKSIKFNKMKTKIKYIIGVFLLLFMVSLFVFTPLKKEKKVIQPELLAFNQMSNNITPIQRKKKELFQFEITKNTTDTDFLNIMETVKKDKIDILFNNVERNENNEIINIEIFVSKEDLSEEFQDNNQNGIQPILIKIYEDHIFIGYAYQENNSFSFFEDDEDNTNNQMAMMQKMMQRQMQMLQQLRGSSNNNDIFAQFFGNDPIMQNPDKMMQKMMQQMMQADSFFSSGNHNSDPKVQSEIKMEKHYIVNGKEMTEEEYQKFDKSKIRSLQIYQTQVVSKRYGM